MPFAVGGHTFKSPELDAFFRADGGWYTPTGASVQLDPTAAECVARLKLHEKELRAASPVAKDLEVRLLTQHDALVTVSSAVTESVEVLALVDAIGALVAKHDWKAVLAHCDPSHYKVQVDQMGMGEPQYVAEALGLHAVGNSIAGESGIAWDDINRISKIEVASFTGSADWLEAHGSVTLSDGSTLKLTFVLVRAGERWFISGAVG